MRRNNQLLLASLIVLTAACQTKDGSVAMTDTTMNASMTTDAVAPMAAPDAEMKAVLDQLGTMGGKPIETLTAAEARKQPTPADAAMAVMKAQGKPTAPDPAVTSVDRTIQTAGGALPVRVYTPVAGTAPFPVVVYYHGGGWVIADKQVYDAGARGLAKAAGAVVISVDYRQGPENRFPAAHDDAYATYEWALANAASLKGDPKKIALAGESAGGGLAVATAIMARDKKAQMPLAIVSIYPIAGTDTATPSYKENANAKPLSRAMMSWFFDNYLNGPQDRNDPRVNLVAANLAGLPATTIINAQIDPLRSDGELLAQKMRDAGVTVEQRTYENVTHEFFGMAAIVSKAMAAQQMAGDALKAAFAR